MSAVEDEYKVNKGICYIFANFLPKNEKEHKGNSDLLCSYIKDVDNITRVFKENLSFTVKDPIKNLAKKPFLNQLKKIEIFLQENRTYDQLVVFILSHGNKKGLLMCKDRDGKHKEVDENTGEDVSVPFEDIHKIFSHSSIPSLKGKPRCIFINACRGNNITETASDKNPRTDLSSPEVSDCEDDDDDNKSIPIPSQSDMLVFYSSLPTEFSHGTRGKGSWFIFKLIEVMEKHIGELAGQHSNHLLDILTKVIAEVSSVPDETRKYPCNIPMKPNISLQIKCDDGTFKACYACFMRKEDNIGKVYYHKETKGHKSEKKYVEKRDKIRKYKIPAERQNGDFKEREYHIRCYLIHKEPKVELGEINQPLEEFEKSFFQHQSQYETFHCELHGKDNGYDRPFGCGTLSGDTTAKYISRAVKEAHGGSKAVIKLADGNEIIESFEDKEARFVKKVNGDDVILKTGKICTGENGVPFLEVNVMQLPIFHSTLTKKYYFRKPSSVSHKIHTEESVKTPQSSKAALGMAQEVPLTQQLSTIKDQLEVIPELVKEVADMRQAFQNLNIRMPGPADVDIHKEKQVSEGVAGELEEPTSAN